MKICQKFVCFDSSVGAASSKNSSQQKSRIWKVWKNIYYLLWQLLSEKWYYKMLFSIKFWTTFYYFIFFAVIRHVIILLIIISKNVSWEPLPNLWNDKIQQQRHWSSIITRKLSSSGNGTCAWFLPQEKSCQRLIKTQKFYNSVLTIYNIYFKVKVRKKESMFFAFSRSPPWLSII